MLHNIYPNQYHLEYHELQPRPQDVLLGYRKGSVLCRADSEELVYPTAGELNVDKAQFLFSMNDLNYFMMPEETVAGEQWQPRTMFQLRTSQPKHLAFAGVIGNQMTQFYCNNRFCGRCGSPMHHSTTERAMVCPSCGRVMYPQICPSVIVAVVRGDEILLTKYQASHSSFQNYALIAGYNETGESIEETVKREVLEEVGLHVTDLCYYKSQPWPFSGALLFGFFCRVEGSSEVHLDTAELREGSWIKRSDLDPRPDSPSLTGEMIEQFRLGKDPFSHSEL